MRKIENIGVSGAKLEFRDDCVIKTGGDRLIKQAQKQILFSKTYSFDSFSAPYVYALNPFKMAKVHGRNWYDFFLYGGVKETLRFFDGVTLYLKFFKSRAILQEVSIEDKLESLYGKSDYKKFIKYLNQWKLIKVPIGFCHGDLTLQNIIFNDRYYLIDFLDSYIESYLIDLAKLRQDSHYRYCLLYMDLQSNKCEIAFNRLNQLLINEFPEIDSLEFKIIEAINILRIEPYFPKEKLNIVRLMLEKNPLYVEFNNSSLR